jgi:hypothetical protein
VNLTVAKDFGSSSQTNHSSSQLISSLAAGLFGSLAVVVSVILTDSLVINRVSDPLLRWPLAIAVGLVISLKFIVEGSLINARSESARKVERLYLARVVSPGLASTLFVSLFAVIYIWTQSYLSALVGAVVIATPYFLLFLVFPRLAISRLATSKRNLVFEVMLIGAFTFGVYTLIQLAPATVIDKSKAFILLGLVPGLIHGIYSIFVASSEHEARKAERIEEAVS